MAHCFRCSGPPSRRRSHRPHRWPRRHEVRGLAAPAYRVCKGVRRRNAGLDASGRATVLNEGGHHMMKEATKRSITRWIHFVFSIPILGYIYSPFEELPKYADRVRFVVVPVILLSGLWMWKGHVVRRLISKRSAQPARLLAWKPGQEFE